VAKKICGECGAPRGTKHKDDCSNAPPLRQAQQEEAKRRPTAMLVTRMPLKKSEIQEGLAASRGSGRIAYHTPMNKAPCACGSGKLFVECHGKVESSEFETPEPPVEITDLRQLLENNAWANLEGKLEGGTVEYVDPAIDAGERQATVNELLVFRSADGRPQVYMPLSVYNQFAEHLRNSQESETLTHAKPGEPVEFERYTLE
jgi:hypothetical protein